jgi:tetratricopeptide (TPR) repeat protein
MLLACGSHKKNFMSKAYHNTTAHFNAYFIAKENIRMVEEAIESSHQNNYDEILGVYFDIDSSTIDGVRDKLDDAIVKGSLPIQRHENSNWVYPSYYLIGKARYYGGDFVNAIETFRFIYRNGEEDDIRQKALVGLMRSYIDYDEHANAMSVADYLRKENLSRANEVSFLLTKAYLFQRRENYEKMLENLSQAADLERNKKAKARYFFILGQLHQQMGHDNQAYGYYRKCLKSNPDYELSFYAKLNLAQVTRLEQTAGLKKIRKYFERLLKDQKNKEFVDRIYYEMANFELKNNNEEQAVQYFKSAIRASVSNPRQKGLAFLRLGELYYEHRRNYELAQAYYDSAVNTLPREEENYEAIKERATILTDFITQLRTIQLQDSLLALSEMPTDALQQLLEQHVEDLERQRREEERAEQLKAARSAATSNRPFGGGGFGDPFGAADMGVGDGDSWYFYNLTAVGAGRTTFRSRWGDRPLEDNWRRSQKQLAGNYGEAGTPEPDQPEQTIVADQEATETGDEIGDLMATIPFSKEDQEASLRKIEEAYFKLGGIYNFQLDETDNAISTFEKLLERFPDSEFEPETLYLLYLIYQETNKTPAIGYKQRLIDKYPESIFAKLALNPNYKEESNEASQRLKRLYKIAYDYYRQEDFDQAKLLVSRALQQYPDNEFSDQLRILGILIDGKTEGQYKYQFELQQFVENHPESHLVSYANKLLQASRSFESKELQRKGATYIDEFDQPHFFIFVYADDGSKAEVVPPVIEKYVEETRADANLKLGNLPFGDGFSAVLINKFATKDLAMDFYNEFLSGDDKIPLDEETGYQSFVITEDNFQILYQVKKTDNYLRFFEKYYLP